MVCPFLQKASVKPSDLMYKIISNQLMLFASPLDAESEVFRQKKVQRGPARLTIIECLGWMLFGAADVIRAVNGCLLVILLTITLAVADASHLENQTHSAELQWYALAVLIIGYILITSCLWTIWKLKLVFSFARQVGAQSPEVGGPVNVNDVSQQQQQAGLHLGREHQAMAVEEPWQLIQEERVVRDAENQTVAGTLTSNVEAPPPAGGSSRARRAPRQRRGEKLYQFSGRETLHFADCGVAEVHRMRDVGTLCRLCG